MNPFKKMIEKDEMKILCETRQFHGQSDPKNNILRGIIFSISIYTSYKCGNWKHGSAWLFCILSQQLLVMLCKFRDMN